jgi:hypothetical protein
MLSSEHEEGRVLEWSDVDFTTNKIRIARAWDYEEECTKATKTWATRDVPIEPTLLPLLKAMHKRAGGKGLVLPMLSGQPDELSVSKVFRDHLEAVGVDRPDLFAREPDADPDPSPVTERHRDHLASLARRQPLRGAAQRRARFRRYLGSCAHSRGGMCDEVSQDGRGVSASRREGQAQQGRATRELAIDDARHLQRPHRRRHEGDA